MFSRIWQIWLRCEICGRTECSGVLYRKIKGGAACCQMCYLDLPRDQRVDYQPLLSPTTSDPQTQSSHQRLVDWVWQYFSQGLSNLATQEKVVNTGKPPLYFQHDGHSRTIVGIEQSGGTYNLIILDPGFSAAKFKQAIRYGTHWLSECPK